MSATLTATSVAGLVALGGREWQKGDRHRIYFNGDVLLGLARAAWSPLSNNWAREIVTTTIYYDCADGKFYGASRDLRDFAALLRERAGATSAVVTPATELTCRHCGTVGTWGAAPFTTYGHLVKGATGICDDCGA